MLIKEMEKIPLTLDQDHVILFRREAGTGPVGSVPKRAL